MTVRLRRSVPAIWSAAAPVTSGTRPDGATAAYQKMLEIDASSDEAFDALEKLHAAAGRWEPLVELLLGRLESRELASQRAELLRKIARVFEEHLDDKGQALDALINALSEDFHDRETARYLERIAQATGRSSVGVITVGAVPASARRLQQPLLNCWASMGWDRSRTST